MQFDDDRIIAWMDKWIMPIGLLIILIAVSMSFTGCSAKKQQYEFYGDLEIRQEISVKLEYESGGVMWCDFTFQGERYIIPMFEIQVG